MTGNKIFPGQRLRGLPAGDWNRFIDLTRRRPGERRERSLDDRPAVWVHNNSGADVEPNHVLGIGGLQVPVADNEAEARFRTPYLDGETTVAATHTGKFAVALEAIPAGESGRAAIEGLAIVELETTGFDAAHVYADVKASSDKLQSGWYGAAEILASELVSGQRWALVRLGLFQAPEYLAKVTQSGGIAAGASGSAEIYINGVSKGTVTAFLSWAEGTNDAGENAECYVRFFRDEQKWRIVTLDCEG